MVDSGVMTTTHHTRTDQTAIPSLGQLALKYGTINSRQLERALAYVDAETARGQRVSLGQTLVNQGSATAAQINLLNLIREFLVLRKQGEKFGQIAVEKGFATPEEVNWALEVQKQAFKQKKVKRLVGDLLVEAGAITPEQRDLVTREQKRFEQEIERTFHALDGPEPKADRSDLPGKEAKLSDFEKEYLSLRALDQNFARNVVEKGFATQKQVDDALEMQATAFRELERIVLLGDVMVSKGILTPEQREAILSEQSRLQTSGPELKPVNGTFGQRPRTVLPPAPEPQETGHVIPHPAVEILISGDAMEASVKLTPDDVRQVNLEAVLSAARARGIQYGLVPDRLIVSHLDRGDTAFIIACGTRPVHPGSLVPVYGFPTHGKNPASNDASLPLQVIKGEALAELGHPETRGQGKDILGRDLPAPPVSANDITLFRCGSGARIARDQTKAFAGKSGTPHLTIDGKLHVFSNVHVLEDADFRYGPIEPNANLRITGTLTGAFPVQAGHLTASEIRGADIDALGSIRVDIGITGTTIRTQGSIHARYIHNCTIYAFGDVIVEHEILDSRIVTSGKCVAGKSRIIASAISARLGVEAGGIGSDVTEPCVISVGREDHLVSELNRLDTAILQAGEDLERLSEALEDTRAKGVTLFNQMVRLKVFHDRAKKQKRAVKTALEANPETDTKQAAKTENLFQDLSRKMETIIASLKELNRKKSLVDEQGQAIEEKLGQIRPGVEKTIEGLEADRRAFLKWSLETQGSGTVSVKGAIAQGTRIQGVLSSLTVGDTLRGCCIEEKPVPDKPETAELLIGPLAAATKPER